VLGRLYLGHTVIGVLADHATSCLRKAHTADPVPFVLAGGPIVPDATTSYGETACAEGTLGELRGVEVLPGIRRSLR